MQFISPNELLTALPPVIYERLAPHFQKVRLEAGSVLFDIGATNDHTWFITRGIVSLLGITENGASVEIAMAGHDSVIGLPGIVGGNETQCRAQVQITGAAFRVSARILQTAMNRESQIYLPLLDHTRILSKQITQAAICNQFHTIDQRRQVRLEQFEDGALPLAVAIDAAPNAEQTVAGG